MERILIADDDKFFREKLKLELRQRGYVVEAVRDGKDAVRKCRDSAYAVLIVDAHLETMSGAEVIAAVKKIHRELPVIVITGDHSLELERELRSLGIFYYLIKPFGMQEMLEVVESAMILGSRSAVPRAGFTPVSLPRRRQT